MTEQIPRTDIHVRAALMAGADRTGNATRAAVFLLCHTDLPDTPELLRYLNIEDRPDDQKGKVTCAFVPNWHDIVYLGKNGFPQHRQILAAAGAFAGLHSSFRDHMEGLSERDAALVAAAVLIATGTSEMYEVFASRKPR